MGILFAIGSFCFVLGSVPLYFDNVDAAVVGATFFVGSVFFTTAATLQVRASRTSVALFAHDAGRVNWWSAAVQWVGTLEFNVSTFAALLAGLSAAQQKKLVWNPDVIGSALFLASSVLALVALRMAPVTRRDRGIAWLNMIGSINFGIAAVAAYVLPATGDPISIQWVNLGTGLGGVCFFVASVWMARPAPRRTIEPSGAA